MRYGIVGYSGRMGQELAALFAGKGHELVLSADKSGENVSAPPQVVLDFSLPQALPVTLRLCRSHKSALVLGTTGLGEAEAGEVRRLAQTVPVIHSSNFGVGTNILAMILRDYSGLLAEWELEIEEAHHNKKIDAPSGTALMLMRATGRTCPAHSLRLGNLPGDHTAHFAMGDELLSFTHRAVSRSMFAAGALKAAEFAVNSAAGYYNFQDVLRLAKK